MEDFRNRTFGTPRHSPARLYPVVQWHHQGNGAPGGLEIPTRFFADPDALTLPSPVEVSHSASTERAWILERFHLALVGFREVQWERRRGKIVELAPPGLAEPWKHGYRSRRRLLVVVKELWEAGYRGFVVATFRATSSQDVSGLIHAAGRFRQSAGLTSSETAYPEYAFYVPTRAGKPKEIFSQDGSQSSYVSPIECLLPEQPGEEDFARLVIPLGLQTFIEARLDEVIAWEEERNESIPAGTFQGTMDQDTSLALEDNDGDHGAGHEVSPECLRVVAPVGTKTHPEFRGQTLEDLLKTPEGRQFVGYLAARYRPRSSKRQAVVTAAQALVEAGLTR